MQNGYGSSQFATRPKSGSSIRCACHTFSAMEARLSSCIAYALRLSYRMSKPDVSLKLKQALGCAQVGNSQRPDPTSEVAELKGSKVAISLYDSVRCRPYSHGEVQTVANICTEEECRTVVMGVMTDVRQHIADLTDTTTSLLRERDAIISRLENELQEKVSCLADLAAKHATSPQDLDVVHREAKPSVSTVHSGGSMPPRVIACEMATLEQLRERH